MVMFRAYVRDRARTLGARGEVENLPDGTVRVYAEGEKEKLERLIAALKKGSPFSRVENVAFQWAKPTGGFTSFSIVYG